MYVYIYTRVYLYVYITCMSQRPMYSTHSKRSFTKTPILDHISKDPSKILMLEHEKLSPVRSSLQKCMVQV